MATYDASGGSTLHNEEQENVNKNSSASARRQGTERKSFLPKWLRRSTRRLGFGRKGDRRGSSKADLCASSELNLQYAGGTAASNSGRASKAVDTREPQCDLGHHGTDSSSNGNLKLANSAAGEKYVANACSANGTNQPIYRNGGKSMTLAGSEGNLKCEYTSKYNEMKSCNRVTMKTGEPIAVGTQTMPVEFNDQVAVTLSLDSDKHSKCHVSEVKLDSVDSRTIPSSVTRGEAGDGTCLTSLELTHSSKALRREVDQRESDAGILSAVEHRNYGGGGDCVVMERKQFDELMSELSFCRLRLKELQCLLEDGGIVNESLVTSGDGSSLHSSRVTGGQVYSIPVLHCQSNTEKLCQNVNS